MGASASAKSTATRTRRARQPPAQKAAAAAADATPRRMRGEPAPLRLDYVSPARERLLVRIDEAAAILAYERKIVYQLLRAREIESIGSGTRRRILVESLRAYVEREREREREKRGA